VPIPDKWNHPRFPARTSADEFLEANAKRKSDLSAKRNLGLLLARLHGWNKIAFIDDDVRDAGNLARLAAQLEQHQVGRNASSPIPRQPPSCATLVGSLAFARVSS
jgi:hypothetical protein